MNDEADQNNSSKKQSTQKVQSAMKHLNPCFLTTSVQNNDLKVPFCKIRCIQIQIYPQTFLEPKHGPFYFITEVRVHGLVCLV